VKEWLVPLVAAVLGGSLAQGIALLRRSGAERDSVVVGSAERTVLFMERQLERLERRNTELEVRERQLEEEIGRLRMLREEKR
jgi:hypothetical protein